MDMTKNSNLNAAKCFHSCKNYDVFHLCDYLNPHLIFAGHKQVIAAERCCH